MKLRLVEGWRSAWRWYSMQLHVIGTMLASMLVIMPQMPAEVQRAIPEEWRVFAIAAWFVLGVLARVTQQKPSGRTEEPKP